MLASVITCIFNQREEYLQQCAQSVAQQGSDIEWIVVDDGSCPDAKRVHRRVIDSDAPNTKVRLIELPENIGIADARNHALESASGQWIIVLDSDDRLTPDIISALANLPDFAQVVCVEVNYFDECMAEHRPITRYERLFQMYGGTTRDPFLWFDFYYHGIITRRSLLNEIGGYNPALRIGEDQDILLRATEAVATDQVFFLNQVGYEYRNNPAGVCNSRWSEVAANYTRTMLEAANRRGGRFVGCCRAGTEMIDDAAVDCYSYQLISGEWVSWRDCYRQCTVI